MNVDTHLSDKEVSKDALVKNEAVKEELTDTTTKAVERIQIGSNAIFRAVALSLRLASRKHIHEHVVDRLSCR